MIFLGNKVSWRRQDRAGRRRKLAQSKRPIIWGIKHLRWQDKSNQNAETMKRQATHVLLTNCTHWSHKRV